MSRSRISEGFHRVGLVVAVPCLIGAVVWTFSAWFHHREVVKLAGPAIYRPTVNVEGPGGIVADFPAGSTEWEIKKTMDEVAGLPPNQRETALRQRAADAWLLHEAQVISHRNDAQKMIAALIGLAVGFYAASRALGWIGDGFRARPENPPPPSAPIEPQ